MKNVEKILSILVFGLVTGVPLFSLAQSSAELYRTDGYRYGKFEAGIKMAGGKGVISSFFLWKDKSELQDVYWNEIDIEKFGENCNQFLSNLLYGMPQANHSSVIETEDDLCADFHTYTIEWTPERITWFVDGVQMRESTPEDAVEFEENAEEGMQFRFNVWVGNSDFGGVLDTVVLPVHEFIDWVQYSEYTPGEGDENTDFTLSWREEFDSAPTGSWQKGNWGSPYNLSIHHPQNVTYQDGMAILSLTREGEEGYVAEASDTESDMPDTELSSNGDSDNDASVTDDASVPDEAAADAGCGCNAVGTASGTDSKMSIMEFLLRMTLR